MDSIKVLHISFRKLPLYEQGAFDFDFTATDRVNDPCDVFDVHRHVRTQKIEAIVGINASGKTSALKLVHLAMAIVIDHTNLTDLKGKELLGDDSEMRVVFAYRNMCYELQSFFATMTGLEDSTQSIVFREEVLKKKTLSSIHSKRDILTFEASPMLQRSKLSIDVLSILKNDDSIVINVTRDNRTPVRNLMPFTGLNFPLFAGSIPSAALHVFDSHLDEMRAEKGKDDVLYTIKFANQNTPIKTHSVFDLNDVISSGSIKGQNMILLIKNILIQGGYLIIDELENHMNKELLRMIINIFRSENLNKNGACLIFTTHYTELLDFIHRKDSIYITRRAHSKTENLEILNYAREVKRNDVKKSEIILSNYIDGTAPSYENISALENYLLGEVSK